MNSLRVALLLTVWVTTSPSAATASGRASSAREPSGVIVMAWGFTAVATVANFDIRPVSTT